MFFYRQNWSFSRSRLCVLLISRRGPCKLYLKLQCAFERRCTETQFFSTNERIVMECEMSSLNSLHSSINLGMSWVLVRSLDVSNLLSSTTSRTLDGGSMDGSEDSTPMRETNKASDPPVSSVLATLPSVVEATCVSHVESKVVGREVLPPLCHFGGLWIRLG